MRKSQQFAIVRCVSPPMNQEASSFDTTTAYLLELADWLGEHECAHVAMEATGVYWKPVWHVLEAEFELVLANAAHIRNVLRRKTDSQRCDVDLRFARARPDPLELRAAAGLQRLRDLTRTRKQFVREANSAPAC